MSFFKLLIYSLFSIFHQVSEIFDEVDVEDSSRSGQFAIINEHGQTEYYECAEEPSAKRARLDINYSIAPAGTFTFTDGSSMNVQKTATLGGPLSQQIMQQQQIRRKIAIVQK